VELKTELILDIKKKKKLRYIGMSKLLFIMIHKGNMLLLCSMDSTIFLFWGRSIE